MNECDQKDRERERGQNSGEAGGRGERRSRRRVEAAASSELESSSQSAALSDVATCAEERRRALRALSERIASAILLSQHTVTESTKSVEMSSIETVKSI